MTRPLTITPLPTDHELVKGEDLVTVLLGALDAAGVALADGDVVTVASKVVAKVEGAIVALPPGQSVDEGRRTLTRREATRIVADTPHVLVVETAHGFVCANAGIDTSNVRDEGIALLLPRDPDASAARIAAALHERTGHRVGVVVTDTFGRPWRLGQTDVAIGAAGLTTLRDDRGELDRDGHPLTVTMVAIGDEVAAAADLVRRKHDGTPFVLLRGLDMAGDGTGADLVRPAAEDLFPTGGPTTVHVALEAAARAHVYATPAPAPIPAVVVATLRSSIRDATHDRARMTIAPATDDAPARLTFTGPPVERGAARTAVLAVLAAHGLVAATTTVGTDQLALDVGT